MVKTLKRAAVAVAVAGALGASAPASALTGIQFDPTGLGGAGLVLDQFVWGNNQILALNLYGLPVAAGVGEVNVRTGFLLGQGTLAQEKLAGSPIGGSFTGFSYTFKIPITASSTNTTGGACASFNCFTIFADAAVADFYGADNYFRIYDNAVAPDLTAGTGFDGGVKIFDGNVNIGSLGTSFVQSSGTLTTIGTAGGTTAQAGVPIDTIAGSGSLRLDVNYCSADDIANAVPQCTGGTAATGATALTAYFRSNVDGLTVDVDLATSFGTPFDAVPVPAVIGGITPDFGVAPGSAVGPKINNFHCEGGSGGVAPCDMIYQGSSADSYWKGTVVPEPGSVALLGLGLALLGGMARRKSA